MARKPKPIEVPGDQPSTPAAEIVTKLMEPPAEAQPESTPTQTPETKPKYRYTKKEGNWVLTAIGWQFYEED